MAPRLVRFGLAVAVVAGAMLAPLQSQQTPPQGSARQNTGAKKHLALVRGIALSRVEVVVKDGVVHKGGPAARAARPSSQAR